MKYIFYLIKKRILRMGLLILTKALFIRTTVFFASCFMYNYVQFLKRGYGKPDSSPDTMTGYRVRYTNNFVFTIMEIIASGLFITGIIQLHHQSC